MELRFGMLFLILASAVSFAGQREATNGGAQVRIPASREINQIVSDYLNQVNKETEIRELRKQTELIRPRKIENNTGTAPTQRPSQSYGIISEPEKTAVDKDPIFNRRPEPVRETIPTEFNERLVRDVKRIPSSEERIQDFIRSFKANALRAGYEVEVDPQTLEVTKVQPIKNPIP